MHNSKKKIALARTYGHSDNWRIKVADILTGECRISEDVQQTVCTIHTAGWKSGVYAVHATDGVNTAYTKFAVK